MKGLSTPQMKGAKFLSLKFKHQNILLAEKNKIKNIGHLTLISIWLGVVTVVLYR